jgi:hypothetical protein
MRPNSHVISCPFLQAFLSFISGALKRQEVSGDVF